MPGLRQHWPHAPYFGAVANRNLKKLLESEGRIDQLDYLDWLVGHVQTNGWVEVQEARELGRGNGDLLLGPQLLDFQQKSVGPRPFRIRWPALSRACVGGSEAGDFAIIGLRLANDGESALGAQQGEVLRGDVQQSLVARRRRPKAPAGYYLPGDERSVNRVRQLRKKADSRGLPQCLPQQRAAPAPK